MKKMLFCLLFFLSSCSNIPYKELTPSAPFKELGSLTSNQTWVYLCGLLTDFIPDLMDELKILDTIGKQLDIKFLAMIPKNRCPNLGNRLCWPQDNKKEVLQTYQEILNSLQNQTIKGYIGFSNGGFFFNILAQYIELDKPIISIGASAPLFTLNGPENIIYLLIGKQDQWHYKIALDFYNLSKKSNLMVHLIEYDEGHMIPANILKDLLAKLTE